MKVILRFLKNKAIEIGQALLYFLKRGLIWSVISSVLIFISFIIGLLVQKWEWFMITFEIPSNVTSDAILAGFVFVVVSFMCLALVAIIAWIVMEFIGWIKENWERANREIKEENERL